MKTWPLSKEGEKPFAFEVKGIAAGPRSIGDLLKSVSGVSDVKVRPLFDKSPDVHVEFRFHGREFMVWEPYGDNSRYWIGPRSEEEKPIDITELEQAFQNYRPSWFAKLLGA